MVEWARLAVGLLPIAHLGLRVGWALNAACPMLYAVACAAHSVTPPATATCCGVPTSYLKAQGSILLILFPAFYSPALLSFRFWVRKWDNPLSSRHGQCNPKPKLTTRLIVYVRCYIHGHPTSCSHGNGMNTRCTRRIMHHIRTQQMGDSQGER